MKSAKVFLGALVLGFCLGINVSYASGDAFVPAPTQYSYIPHVYLFGFAGSSVTGRGDILQPLFLRSDRNFFAYGQGNYGYADEDWAKNPWTGSAGLGYRQIGNSAVYGFFVLGDYSRTTTDHSIWQVSPGLEILGRAWEFHANGYIPVSKKDWSTTEFASEVGNYDYIHFSGHDQFDAKFRFNEEAGAGGDAELGRVLFTCHNTVVTGFINGYFYHMDDNPDIKGGGAAITVRPNTYLELSVNGSYDNYAHTVVMLGVQISLYDLFSSGNKILNTQDLQRRLFDPIHRGFGNLASGSDVRMSGGPRDEETRKAPEPIILGHDFLQRSNVWFFNGAGLSQIATPGLAQDLADGTYEHPFSAADFNQVTVKQIHDNTIVTGAFANAYLYFNKGTYNTFDTAALGASFVRLELFPGESMWGRMGTMKGFQMPASGAARPNFIGGLMLDSSTSLNDLTLQNSPAAIAAGIGEGVVLNGATNVEINNTMIGANDSNTGYVVGIDMGNNSQLSMSNSTVLGYDAPASDDAGSAGIRLSGNSELTLGDGNMISATAIGGIGVGAISAAANSIGINANNSTINISGNNNTVTATATAGNAADNAFAIADGIEAKNNSTVIISGKNNTFAATGTGGNTNTSGDTFATGIAYAVFLDDSMATISGSNNTFSGTATGGNSTTSGGGAASQAFGDAAGIFAQDSSMVTISGDNNAFSATATGGTAIGGVGLSLAYGIATGVFVQNTSTVTISGNSNIFSATATGGTNEGMPASGSAFGIRAFNMSTINFASTVTGTQITVGGFNGTPASFGISVEGAGSSLQLDGVAVSSPYMWFTTNIVFTRTGSGGLKISGLGGDVAW